MQIKKMKLKDLKPADYNPRVNLVPGMQEYEKLKQSIIEFGFVDPPIFNYQTGNLVGGHQRVAVAKDLGMYDEIEVSIVDLPPNKEKALNVALNKISGVWDDEKLSELIHSLNNDEKELIGFVEKELDSILDIFENEDSPYTNKIEIPQYEITEDKPDVTSLVDDTKTIDLINKIKEANIPKNIEAFLIYSAYRHLVFDYGKIAEFYAHSDKDIQELFEQSALVIIDFENAIADGYVRLNSALDGMRDSDE